MKLLDYLRRLKSDANNILRFGLSSPRDCQILYCDPSDILEHTVFVSTPTLPDSCATVSSRFARDVREIWRLQRNNVLGGDWDKATVPLSSVMPYSLTLQRLKENVSWKDVGEYSRMLKIISIIGSSDDCRSVSDLDERYQTLDKIIEDIRQNRRLKTQRELRTGSFREEGGIMVAISRDGKIIKIEGGTHRLAIVHHFDLPVIPVCVKLVHESAMLNGKFRRMLKKSEELRCSGPASGGSGRG